MDCRHHTKCYIVYWLFLSGQCLTTHFCQNLGSLFWIFTSVCAVRSFNPPYGKRWRLYILPQYHANLTQPISSQKATFFAQICPCASNIPYAKFEVFRTFLCVFMSVFRVLTMGKCTIRHLHFGTVDCEKREN